jgi:hypothetical protein
MRLFRGKVVVAEYRNFVVGCLEGAVFSLNCRECSNGTYATPSHLKFRNAPILATKPQRERVAGHSHFIFEVDTIYYDAHSFTEISIPLLKHDNGGSTLLSLSGSRSIS